MTMKNPSKYNLTNTVSLFVAYVANVRGRFAQRPSQA